MQLQTGSACLADSEPHLMQRTLSAGASGIFPVELYSSNHQQRSSPELEIAADLLDEATATNKTVQIYVEKYNPALRLYQRLGFSEQGDTGVYYFMEWSAAS